MEAAAWGNSLLSFHPLCEIGRKVRVRTGRRCWGLRGEETKAKAQGQNPVEQWWRRFSKGVGTAPGSWTFFSADPVLRNIPCP